MNPMQEFLAQPLSKAVGWALIHFIWQGAIVAILFACARASLKRSSANVRYTVACASLALMLALPLITTFVVRGYLDSSASVAAQGPTVKAGDVSPVRSKSYQASDTGARDDSPKVQTSTFERWASSERFNFMMPWLVALWLVGVSLLSLRAFGGWVMAQRLKKRMAAPTAQVWQDVLARLALRMKVSRAVRLCESALAEVPTVIGWLRPVILLPASALTGLGREQMEALLAHELAHIRRHDYLTNLLQTAVETLLFYHPAVWWVSREIRMEREHACDDLAVAACGDVLMYARTLAELEEMRASAAPQLAVAANGGSLLARVRRLLETPSQSSHRPTAWLASVIALIAVFSVWASAHTRLRAGDVASAAIERLREAYVSTEKNPASASCPAHAAANHASDAALTITDPLPIRVDVRADGAIGPQAEMADAAAATSQQPGESVTPPTPPATQATQSPETPQPPPATPAPDAPDTPAPPDDDNTPRGRQSQSAHMDYIDELAALGLTNLTIDQLIEMKSHGVTSDFIRGLRGTGYNVTKPSTLIALRDHGVTAAYVKEMASLGFNNLSLEALIAARDHGVTAEYAHAMEEAGYGHLTLEQIIAARDHGVSTEYVRALADAGYSHLSLGYVIAARDHGVSAEYITELKQAGYSNLSLAQVIQLRDHGVTANFLKKVKAHGFTNLTLEQLIRLRESGILE